jgi:hypothetical protein
MAETRLTNVVVPSIFTQYTMEPSIHRSRFFRSGVIVRNPSLDNLLSGGGLIFNRPFWQDLADTEAGVPSETVALTVGNITADDEKIRRQLRERGWGANDISAVEAGDDPLTAIQNRVIEYWAREFDKNLVNSVTGVIADNIANDSSDLINDISSSTTPVFSDDAVIDTQSLMGENGVVGRDDSEDFVGIAVHPKIYQRMRILDLINFVPISGQTRPIPFYMGMEVVVDKRMPTSLDSTETLYDTVIFKRGAFEFGQSIVGYEPTSTDRDETKGFGIDQLFSRRVFSMHPLGFEWSDSSVAGTSPTNAELALATNWNRVWEKENIRFVVLRSRGE